MPSRLHTRDSIVTFRRSCEGHALVSLRGQELELLAVRGRFAVSGRILDEVVLEEGQVIDFAPGLSVEIHTVAIRA